jgi:hypothetical protein
VTAVTPSARTARQKLARSQLSKQAVQNELLNADVDVDALKVYISKVFRFDLADRIVQASVTRTMEGGSHVDIVINDYDRAVLRSGVLSSKFDINLDGLWWRFRQLKKSGDNLTFVFEEREVAVLRTYSKKIWAPRSTTTRAEFIVRMLKEVREFKIPYTIPELHKVQPIVKSDDSSMDWEQQLEKEPGIIPGSSGQGILGNQPTGGNDWLLRGGLVGSRTQLARASGLTVKGEPADKSQIANMNTIVKVGQNMGCRRKLMVCAIMTAIQESTLRNLPGGDDAHGGGIWDSAGLFQQTGDWGSYRDRTDPATAARLFYNAAIKVDANDRTRPYWDLCATVQRPKESLRGEYEKHHVEADRIVTAYGIPGGDGEAAAATANNAMVPDGEYADSGTYMYYRWDPSTTKKGKKGQPENSWECMQRLAQEVNWRAFFVSGRFYYMSEDALFKSKPVAKIHEFDDGIAALDGDYDVNKKVATMDLSVRLDRWQLPPGCVVVLQDVGPWNGRWLVTEVTRDLFKSDASVRLKKPDPKLPEPEQNNFDDGTGWGSKSGADSEQANPTLPPPGDSGNAMELAKAILLHKEQGHYRDDNGQQTAQLVAIAAGKKLQNQCGGSVYMDSRVLQGINWLLDNGYWVGTFALCSDHSCNTGQHPKGQAVDISSLGKPGLGWYSLNRVDQVATQLAKEVMQALAQLDVWDLICNGVGSYDTSVQALQFDNGKQRGGTWADDHINHIHWGVGMEAAE